MKLILIITVLATAVLPSAFGQNEPGRDVKLPNQSFAEAQVQRDIAKLDRLLADDFTLINPAGKILNKSQLLADMSSGDLDTSRPTTTILDCGFIGMSRSSLDGLSGKGNTKVRTIAGSFGSSMSM